MIPAFLHQTLSTGYVLASIFTCDPATAPAVTVHLQNHPPQIINSRSSEYLMGLKKHSVSPDYGGEFPNLDGLTSGSFQFKYELSFKETTQTLLHTACIETRSAHITIAYTPTIYISSNEAPGSCRYNATLEHEKHHVKVDIDTIKEFMPYIKTHAAVALESEEHPKPVDADDLKGGQQIISAKLSKALKDATNALQVVRTERQRDVDSREEYERLSEECANER